MTNIYLFSALYCKIKKFSFLIKFFIPSESTFLNRLFTFLIKFQPWRVRCFSVWSFKDLMISSLASLLYVSFIPCLRMKLIFQFLTFLNWSFLLFSYQVTRLLPDAVGTTCGERMEKVYGAEHSHIIRVPFRTEKGMLRKWISRFEVWPYMETFTEVEHKTN